MKHQSIAAIGFYLLLCLPALVFQSCDKADPTPDEVFETGEVTDFDGNTYKTIKIGDQWWMAENLRVRHYRNGLPIRECGPNDSSEWVNGLTGSYTLYNDDPSAPGLLYNWKAVIDSGGICPVGWHVPSDAEWKALEKSLGMSAREADRTGWRSNSVGQQLKMTGLAAWATYQDLWADNSSRFSAKAGGCRLFDGRWSTPLGLFYMGFWWTSTSFSAASQEAWYRYLDYKQGGVFRSHTYKTYGFSVRCVRDN